MQFIQPLLEKTKSASHSIANLSDAERKKLVARIAEALEKNTGKIIKANALDAKKMDDQNPKKDRLLLNPERIKSIADDARNVAKLPDPAGKVLLKRKLKNGLELQKISVPLGVVGVIYESRPNVTADVACLCLRSGNAVVLRGGSDAENSNKAIVEVIREVLKKSKIDENVVQLLPTNRKFVPEFLHAEKYVDILIPRGSAGLIQMVRENAKIPIIETGAGVCHTLVDKSADLAKAVKIVVNAKTQRPSVCNALDTILIDAKVAEKFLTRLAPEFKKFNVEIFADPTSFSLLKKLKYPNLQKAKPQDFGREFLSLACSIRVIKNLEEGLAHIAEFSSKHSEAIVAEDKKVCEKFLREVDAAAVYSNASTRFTDGGVFGLGAEIGISTQKLHARGPFALEKLVTDKWVVRGNGQVR